MIPQLTDKSGKRVAPTFLLCLKVFQVLALRAVAEEGAAISSRTRLLPAYCFLAYLPQRSFPREPCLQVACTRYLSQRCAPPKATNKMQSLCVRHYQSGVSGQSLILLSPVRHDKKTHGYGYRSSNSHQDVAPQSVEILETPFRRTCQTLVLVTNSSTVKSNI